MKMQQFINDLFKIGYPRCFCCNRKMDKRYGGKYSSNRKCQMECDYYIYSDDEQYSSYRVYDILSLKILMNTLSSARMVAGYRIKKHIPYPDSQEAFERILKKYMGLNNFQ